MNLGLPKISRETTFIRNVPHPIQYCLDSYAQGFPLLYAHLSPHGIIGRIRIPYLTVETAKFVILSAVMSNDVRLRIVVKHVLGGEPYFWSIIPNWKQGKNGRDVSVGDPEND